MRWSAGITCRHALTQYLTTCSSYCQSRYLQVTWWHHYNKTCMRPEDWLSEECKLKPTLTFDLLTWNVMWLWNDVHRGALWRMLISRGGVCHITLNDPVTLKFNFWLHIKWVTRTWHVLCICQVWWWYDANDIIFRPTALTGCTSVTDDIHTNGQATLR